jgi:hypothetical protein
MFNWLFLNKILLVLISTTGIFLAFWVYLADRKNKINQTFFGFTLFGTLWMSLDLLLNFPGLFFPYALLIARLEWAMIAVFFIFAYFFSIYFPKESKRYPILDKIVITGEVIFFFLSLFTNTIIKSVERISQFYIALNFGLGGLINLIIMVPLTFLVLFNIFKKYFTLSQLERLRVQYFLIGASIFAIANLIFNVGGILFRVTTATYLGTTSGIFLFGFTALAIVKRQLFGIKVILTEILVGGIAIILLILPFLMPNALLKFLTIFVFLLFSITGYLLIAYTHQEIRQKEILEEKVKERTKELEKAYQQLEKAKEELEKTYNQVLIEKDKFERLYKATLGREMRIIELKEKVKEKEERIRELEEKLKFCKMN